MTEELNQVPDMTAESSGSAVAEDDLFGDYDASLNEDIPTEFDDEGNQTSEVKKDETKTEETDQQVVSPHDQKSFLDITYNKEVRSLNKDEAIEYAQKGMNYDKILDKYNLLKENEGTMSELSRLAEKANLSVGDLMKYLENQWSEHELNEEVNALQKMYPNSNPDLLLELAKSHINDRGNLVSQKQKESENARKQEISRQMDIFNKRYPNVDAGKLDAEVYNLMKQNYTLLEAYESVQADKRAEEDKQRESLEKIARQNEENKKKSLGNTNNNGFELDNDDFIKGLFSD